MEWEDMSEEVRKYWEAYSGKREILGHALFSHGTYDQFGWCQGWSFALCDYLTFEWGESVPGFRPSPMGPDEDAYEYETLREMSASPEQCWYALRILDRYREWLRIAGRDY